MGTDLEVKCCDLESRLHRLSDELWGETTGLTQLTRDLRKAKQMRDDVTIFMAETKENIGDLGNRIDNTGNRAEAHITKLINDLDENGKTQRRNQSNNLLELQTMRAHVHNANEASQAVGGCLSTLSGVMRMILESERVASAVAMQDDVDRSKVALVGYAGAKDGKTSTASSRPVSGRSNTSRPLSSRGSAVRANLPLMRTGTGSPTPAEASTPDCETPHDVGPPISLDQRCISCSSGANETKALLAAFKMACLRYEPGPVSYAKKVYSRSELMNLRDRLLGEAESALVTGTSVLSPTELQPEKHASDTADQTRKFYGVPEEDEDPARPESVASESTRVPSRPDSAALPSRPDSAAGRVPGLGVRPTPQRPARPASSGPTRRRPPPDESSPLG